MNDFAGQTLEQMLGQDFLTWLWYRGETSGSFKGPSGEEFSVLMERRVVVQGGEGELMETASVSGPASELREARLGLVTGKKVIRALLRLEKSADEVWLTTLKAEDFSLGSFRTPRISAPEKDEDPEAAFFEKVFLLEKGLEFLDALYRVFLDLRLGPAWKNEVDAIRAWMRTSISENGEDAEQTAS
ncbi:MAG: hypothetical protein FWG17_07095 [Desulfovibrionaceae bacterium]|nr:hypothetical protein [Desulfovibrionaceae bacterium]